MNMAVGQISALSVVRDIIVRCINCPPVCVAFSIVVEELVLVGAIAHVAVWGCNQVSISGLMGMDVGAQHEWAGGEEALIRVVNRCLPCEGRGSSPEGY